MAEKITANLYSRLNARYIWHFYCQNKPTKCQHCIIM